MNTLLALLWILPAMPPQGTEVTLEQAQKLMDEAAGLPEAQVAELQSTLTKDPRNLSCRLRLMGYHGRRGGEGVLSRSSFADLVVGLVEHHATLDLTLEFSRFLNPPSFQKGAVHWQAAAKAHPADARILGNAGTYLTSCLYVADYREEGTRLLLKARTLDPKNPRWPLALAEAAATELVIDRSRETAARALKYLEEGVLRTPEPERPKLRPEGCHRSHLLMTLAFKAEEFQKAEAHATELLKTVNEKEEGWNYGNAIHEANTILGRLALKSGKVEEATKFLLASGRTPGSPQLDSFGPGMDLAAELLKKNQQAAVLEYFDLCRKFWNGPEALDRLDRWILAVKEGKLPDFRGK